MLKFEKVLLALILIVCAAKSGEIELIFPRTADETSMNSYKTPFEEFGEVGFLVGDKRLQYTINRDILANERFDQIKQAENNLNMLRDLSKNHWIALNKRELTIAKNISKKMKSILLGEYGLSQKVVCMPLAQKIMELKYRCIEQIEMSLNEDLSAINFAPSDDLSRQNYEEYCALYQLSRHITNTPFFRSEVSFDFMKAHGVTTNPKTVVPILEKSHKFFDYIFSKMLEKYPLQSYLLETVYSLKKQSYNSYLDHIYRNLFAIKYSQYVCVDKGQTSGASRNTCMFNSVFCHDLAAHNIQSTKLGSLEKAQNYLSHLSGVYTDYKSIAVEEYRILGCIQNKIQMLKANSGEEAIYSFCSEIQNGKIFPGYVFEISVLETQCHSLLSNFAIFPKTITHNNGDCLFTYFGTGYFGSENFPIIPVSCSTGHAQSLERKP